MTLVEFILILAAMGGALVLGLMTTTRQRRRIREEVLAEPARFAGVIAVVRQKKMLQAENLLINQGRQRQAARMTAVVIRDLIRKGEL